MLGMKESSGKAITFPLCHVGMIQVLSMSNKAITMSPQSSVNDVR